MPVHYALSWQSPHDRLYDVTLRFTAPADDPLLTLPAWRPGRYLIQNYAANVREWSANLTKVGKSSWRVSAHAGEETTVTYRFYAGTLDAGSSFLDEDEAYVNGSNLFMMVDGYRHHEHRLTIAAPADWRIETQLRREDDTFVARDYDYFIDSPIIAAASLTRHSFVEEGTKFHLVFRGDEGIDTEQFVEPVRRIIGAHARLFGGIPTDEYRFLYHVRDRWHGVEHEDSCSILCRRTSLLGGKDGEEGYDHFLSITSHELFHLWNVKRIVPAAFSPYDYAVETPTRLLWAMEGITAYYGDLLIRRAGVWSEAEYLEHLQKEVETLEGSPARAHLSLAQASFDGWLHEQMHDKGNAFVSFYNKGEVVAALLDLTIRHRTNGAKSLDDVMRLLWDEYGMPRRGLEEDGIERAVAQVADVGDFFVRYVHGTDELPYAELFATAGVAFESAPKEGNSLGATLKVMRNNLYLNEVFQGGAAREAGLLPEDELLAIDETRVLTEADVERVVRTIEGSAEALITRAGVVRRVSIPALPDPRPKIRLEARGGSERRTQWMKAEE